MIWNLIIDYVLQQLEINVKLISSYSMHHYMVAYLLDFKGMLITHNPILRAAGALCSDECACACTCLNITGWALFFCFFYLFSWLACICIRNPGRCKWVYVLHHLHIFFIYPSQSWIFTEFMNLILWPGVTQICRYVVWSALISLLYHSFFSFSFLSALAAVNMLFSNSLCDCNPDGNKNPFGCSKLNYKMRFYVMRFMESA